MLLFGFIFGASGQDWNCFYDYMFVVRENEKDPNRQRDRETG